VPPYLSEAWIAALDAALASSERAAALAPVVIEQVVQGVPGAGEVRYRIWVDAAGAHARRSDAGPETPVPDVRLSTDYPTAVAIARGEQNAQIALGHGRLRLGGNIEVLTRRAAALAALDDVAAALRAETTYPGTDDPS
jgi:hypothetical protein